MHSVGNLPKGLRSCLVMVSLCVVSYLSQPSPPPKKKGGPHLQRTQRSMKCGGEGGTIHKEHKGLWKVGGQEHPVRCPPASYPPAQNPAVTFVPNTTHHKVCIQVIICLSSRAGFDLEFLGGRGGGDLTHSPLWNPATRHKINSTLSVLCNHSTTNYLKSWIIRRGIGFEVILSLCRPLWQTTHVEAVKETIKITDK